MSVNSFSCFNSKISPFLRTREITLQIWPCDKDCLQLLSASVQHRILQMCASLLTFPYFPSVSTCVRRPCGICRKSSVLLCCFQQKSFCSNVHIHASPHQWLIVQVHLLLSYCLQQLRSNVLCFQSCVRRFTSDVRDVQWITGQRHTYSLFRAIICGGMILRNKACADEVKVYA